MENNENVLVYIKASRNTIATTISENSKLIPLYPQKGVDYRAKTKSKQNLTLSSVDKQYQP